VATSKTWRCLRCGKSRKAKNLFDALLDIVEQRPNKCAAGHDEKFFLGFPFALGIGRTDWEVKAAYLPKKRSPKWRNGKDKVQFFPFLVIVEHAPSNPNQTPHTSVWTPYWHAIKGVKETKKYGQWAPHMELGVFHDLVEQACKGGFMKRQRLHSKVPLWA